MPARSREKEDQHFVQNEIAQGSDLPPEDRDRLYAAIGRCREASRDVWQFTSWPSRAQAALLPAYELLLLTLDLGDPAIDDLASQPFFQQGRLRKLSRKKPALMIVHLALGPRDQRQRNLCSSWVPLIESFAKRKIAPEDFEAELSRTNLRACTAESRAERRRGRAPAAELLCAADDKDGDQTHIAVQLLDSPHVESEHTHQSRDNSASLGSVVKYDVGRGGAEITLEVAVCIGSYRVVSQRLISKDCSEAIQDIIDKRLLRPLNASTLEQIGRIIRDLHGGNPCRIDGGDALRSASKGRVD